LKDPFGTLSLAPPMISRFRSGPRWCWFFGRLVVVLWPAGSWVCWWWCCYPWFGGGGGILRVAHSRVKGALRRRASPDDGLTAVTLDPRASATLSRLESAGRLAPACLPPPPNRPDGCFFRRLGSGSRPFRSQRLLRLRKRDFWRCVGQGLRACFAGERAALGPRSRLDQPELIGPRRVTTSVAPGSTPRRTPSGRSKPAVSGPGRNRSAGR
jgi:hypothetical protein